MALQHNTLWTASQYFMECVRILWNTTCPPQHCSQYFYALLQYSFLWQYFSQPPRQYLVTIPVFSSLTMLGAWSKYFYLIWSTILSQYVHTNPSACRYFCVLTLIVQKQRRGLKYNKAQKGREALALALALALTLAQAPARKAELQCAARLFDSLWYISQLPPPCTWLKVNLWNLYM